MLDALRTVLPPDEGLDTTMPARRASRRLPEGDDVARTEIPSGLWSMMSGEPSYVVGEGER